MSSYMPRNEPQGGNSPPPGPMNIPGAPASGMQQRGAPAGQETLAAARSLTNPTDLAGMVGGMVGQENLTVAEGFKRSLGIDVNTMLMSEFATIMAQRSDPDPLKKAQRLAAQPQAGPFPEELLSPARGAPSARPRTSAPPPTGRPRTAAPPPANVDALIERMGR
jgi:hypothetical protein